MTYVLGSTSSSGAGTLRLGWHLCPSALEFYIGCEGGDYLPMNCETETENIVRQIATRKSKSNSQMPMQMCPLKVAGQEGKVQEQTEGDAA